MHFGRKIFRFDLLLHVLPCLAARSNIFPAAAAVSKDAAGNWIPSDEFSNTSSINWYPRKHDEDAQTTKSSESSGRNFQDDDGTSIDRAFDDFVNFNNDFNEKLDFKAIPFQLPNGAELISTSGGGNGGGGGGGGGSGAGAGNIATAHFHSTIFPQSPSNLAKPFYPATAAQTTAYSPNAAAALVMSPVLPHALSSPPSSPYASNAYHHSLYQAPPHSQNLENFDYQPPISYLPPPAPSPAPYAPSRLVDNSTNIELNTRHLLYLQPGKCSNSIEVGRLRDLEIKSTVKTGTPDSQKTVCVLMLYSANEKNKLAISMQSTIETASAELATENWLQTNIKIYSLQGGTIVRTFTDANFGPGSSALILTKSSIVLMSILSDRTLDFQIDISTYQSNNC